MKKSGAYTYEDVLRLNNRRRRGEIDINDNPEKIKKILSLNIGNGQIVTADCCNVHKKHIQVSSTEEFIYKFLTERFIIENPELLQNYNFYNLMLYTNPVEFEKELIYAANNATLLGVELTFNSFILKDTPDGWCVTGHKNKRIAALFIPDFVTFIGESAFAEFKNLKIVKLPKRIKGIGDKAFLGCEKLSGINFPNSLEHIGKRAFAHTNLTEVTIPDKITVIEERAFNFSKLQKVTLPKNLKTIKRWAFEGTLIEELHMPSVEVIEDYAFFHCELKGTLILPKNLKKCYASVFTHCYELKTIVIPPDADYDRTSPVSRQRGQTQK